MLTIDNLHARVEENGTEILKGLSLNIKEGEVHAIMGPNGSGKSTLSYVLSGKEDYEVTQGSARLNDIDLLELSADERAAAGLFLAFQYPVEIPGVPTTTFLKTAINAIRKKNGDKDIEPVEFMKLLKKHCAELKINPEMMKRPVNVGFSGGEKKRAEVLQMSMLNPKCCILDETDSGLDIDALRIVADGVNALRDGKRSFLVITHYQRLLDYIKPDIVHIMARGKIIKSGGPELALELEKDGYASYVENETDGKAA